MDWISRDMPEEGTLIMAENQTAGRGTDGARWESEPSMNLTFSFLLYPSFLAVESQFYLNKIISLGLADLVWDVLPGRDDIRIKWPNDIYIGDLKVAGTLIQNGVKGSRLEYAIIGIGLNVNQESFSGKALNPVSLKTMAGHKFDLEALLYKALEKIEYRYNLLKLGLKKAIDDDYLKLLYRFQVLSDYMYLRSRIRAKITGINRYGQLILEIPGQKMIECDLKEIRFEPPPP